MLKKRKNKKLTPQQQRSKMKKDAWDWFSKYIRLRDCLITTGTKEYGVCITCGRQYPFSKLQAGHFQAGRGNAILFEETNCHAQCYGCNCGKSGDQYNYGKILEDMYGKDEVDRLVVLRDTTREIDLEEMTTIRDEYKDLFKETYENN